LDVNTGYSIEVSAFDASGNESAKSTAVSMFTTNLPDTAAPSRPLNVLVTAVSSSTVTLTWNPSSDNVGVTGYKVYVDGASPTSVGNVTSYQVTGLTLLTTYDFNITAFDAAGNESQFSPTVSETTTLPIIT
jgi:chitin-binding protein